MAARVRPGRQCRDVARRARRLAAHRPSLKDRLLRASALLIALVAAQAPPTAPSREEIQRPLPPRVEPPRATLAVDGELERAPCALEREEYRGIRFTPSAVEFENLRGLPAEALRPAFAPYLGSEQPVSVICDIRDRAEAILREAGYIAAVEVPEQRIADGRIRFEVLMARLVGLRVRGDAGRAERLIASYLEPLTGQEVFNRHQAERFLLLAGDLPGYSVRLALRSAGTTRGEVIGEVFVQRIAASLDVTVQNHGSDALGPWGGLVRGQLYGVTGLGDRTSLMVYSTSDFEELRTVQLAHDFRIGGEGLAIGSQVTHAWARPDLNNPALDIDARTLFATAEASYPFIRSEARTLRGAVGFDLVNEKVELNGFDFSRDRLRVAFARAQFEALERGRDPRYTRIEPRWRFSALAEVRQGLDVLGASEPCGANLVRCFGQGQVPPGRAEGDPTALVLRGTLANEFRPVPKLTFAAVARGQYSANPLFSFEEFSVGNYTVGRGYNPGSIAGDSAIAVQAEVRYGSIYPRRFNAVAVEPFVFVDQAWVWNRDRLPSIPRQPLTSIGGGVRGGWGDRLQLELVVALPLDRTAARPSRSAQVLLTLTTRLWPWSLR
ncbi:MAG: ShlB/FhaC/HecB family hemolysin secretion/activation protein [Sphingosinicella sp.]